MFPSGTQRSKFRNLHCACLILNAAAGVSSPVADEDDAPCEGVFLEARTSFCANVSSGFCDSGRLTIQRTAVQMLEYLPLSPADINAEGRRELASFLARANRLSSSSSTKQYRGESISYFKVKSR